MARANKGHISVNNLWNSRKRISGHLNVDPNLYAIYLNPSLSGSQDIVLTRFFYCYNGRVEKGA